MFFNCLQCRPQCSCYGWLLSGQQPLLQLASVAVELLCRTHSGPTKKQPFSLPRGPFNPWMECFRAPCCTFLPYPCSITLRMTEQCEISILSWTRLQPCYHHDSPFGVTGHRISRGARPRFENVPGAIRCAARLSARKDPCRGWFYVRCSMNLLTARGSGLRLGCAPCFTTPPSPRMPAAPSGSRVATPVLKRVTLHPCSQRYCLVIDIASC